MDFEILYRLYFRMSTVMSERDSLRTNIWRRRSPRRPCPGPGAVDRFDGQGRRQAWLFTIARNVWVDHCRRHRQGRQACRGGSARRRRLPGRWRTREEVLASTEFSTPCRSPIKRVFGLRVFEELPFRASGRSSERRRAGPV